MLCDTFYIFRNNKTKEQQRDKINADAEREKKRKSEETSEELQNRLKLNAKKVKKSRLDMFIITYLIFVQF